MATASATTHTDNDASSLPTTRSKRRTDVRSSCSRVPRSLSPLMASAAIINATRVPSPRVTRTKRPMDSRASSRLRSAFPATRKVSTLRTTVATASYPLTLTLTRAATPGKLPTAT